VPVGFGSLLCEAGTNTLACAILGGMINYVDIVPDMPKTMRYSFSYTEKSGWQHLFSKEAEFDIHYKHWINAAVPGARVGCLGLLTAVVIGFVMV
jgi:hypothetical protein